MPVLAPRPGGAVSRKTLLTAILLYATVMGCLGPSRREGSEMRYWVLLSAFVAVVLTCPSLATTYVIRADGMGDLLTIEAAVIAAAEGDTIELTDGTFTGDGNRDAEYLGKAITVRSQSGDPNSCVIDCDGTASDPHRGFHFHSGEGSGSVLAGVTITGGYVSEWGGGILCEGASPTIMNCVLAGNTAGWGGGMLMIDGASVHLSDCIFEDDTATSNGGGLYRSAGSNALLTYVTFAGNAGTYGGGVACNGSSPTLINCTFSDNLVQYTVAGGVWSLGASKPVLQNCIIAFSSSRVGSSSSPMVLRPFPAPAVSLVQLQAWQRRRSSQAQGHRFLGQEIDAPQGPLVSLITVAVCTSAPICTRTKYSPGGSVAPEASRNARLITRSFGPSCAELTRRPDRS